VAWAEAYLHTKWHLDPFNRLATIHQRHRQNRQDRRRSDSTARSVFGQPFVKWFALCYQTVVCLSVCYVCPVLSATLVYCGQTVGWIKMKLGMQVDLDPGHIVLDGVPASLPQKGHRPLNFWPVSLSVVGKWLDGSRCHLVGR